MTIVTIDYTPAVRQQAGIGRIVKGQVSTLIEQNTDLDIRLFIVGKITKEQRQLVPHNLHATPISERNMVRLWHRLGSPWPTVEQFTGGPIDLFHATDFVMAPTKARRTIVTVHDLAFLHYPDASDPSLYRYLNVVVPRSIRKADHIIADSYHSAQDVAELFQVPSEKISVVQGAVDHTKFVPITDPNITMSTRAKYGIGHRPYIFALSSLQPRKNFARLIEAYHLARQSNRIEHTLVIGGGKGWLHEEIFSKVTELHLGDNVKFIGYVDDEDLPALYSDADFFAYPSLYEGFGLPIVEALACGTPVLAANNSCLPEAGGPGAIYADAEDVDSIADTIARLCTDTELKRQLASAGAVHASHFTWERSATQLLDTYRRVLAS